MSKIQEKVAEFFASHPDATEVYEALGVLFTDKERAQKYLAGVAGRMVTNHSREGLTFERESDRIRHDIMNQENLVNQKHIDYDVATSVDKEQAMSAWEKENRKLDDLKARLVKQVEMENKEERIAKQKKAEGVKPTFVKEKTKEQLEAAISAQVAIVETNYKMIETIKSKAKRIKAEKAQADEIQLLDQLRDELARRFPVTEDIVAEIVTGDGSEEETEGGSEEETEK